MDSIKTSFEKMLDKFNDSVTHSAPKKLFDHGHINLNVNELLEDSDSGSAKKRRYSQINEKSDVKENGNNSSLNDSTASIPPSPWEARRLRADLIETESRVLGLKREIKRLDLIRKESEVLYENKVSELKKQCDFSATKIASLEKHLDVLRKREQAAKRELTKVQKEQTAQKSQLEEIIRKLETEKNENEDNARRVQHTLATELNDFKHAYEKLEGELALVHEELEKTQKKAQEYKTRADQSNDWKMKYEKLEHDLTVANSRIRELDYEIGSYQDLKEINRSAEIRLANVTEKDKELEQLRGNNKRLHELISGKLLLEEQVHDLRTRLEKEEGGKQEAAHLQVKLTHVEEELKEWIKVAQDHCLPNVLVSPVALRQRIEQLLQNDIINVSENKSHSSETKSMESQMKDLKQKCDSYGKNIEALNDMLKKQKLWRATIQRKLLVVCKERDFYKQMFENFEKDITMSSHGGSTESNNAEVWLRSRVDVLEKTLAGYKDMASNLEKDLSAAIQVPQIEHQMFKNDGYDHIKKELDTLRIENERLRRRKEELELQLENYCLKGYPDAAKYKVLHMRQNPSAEAYENSKNFIEKLQAEIERLKQRNKKLQEDHDMTLARLNDDETSTNMTVNIKELNQLRAELDTANAKLHKLKEVYKAANMEFREFCYILFGYRVDRHSNNAFYTITSMYAENKEDCLKFRLTESNQLLLLETPYSTSLQPLIDRELIVHHSYPVFLAALTQELFQRATVSIT